MLIYKITNIVNRKPYIGQTKFSVESRWKSHKKDARRGVNSHFYKALRKYGPENFKIEILASAPNKEQLDYLEQLFIVLFDSIENGYNSTFGGDGVPGMSQETRDRMSRLKKGVKHTPEALQKIKDFQKTRRGTHLSEETKTKIGDANRGRLPWTTGRKHSPETIAKMRAKKIRKPISEATRLKMGVSAKRRWALKSQRPVLGKERPFEIRRN